MAAFGFDPANESEGRGKYGRVGYFIVEFQGQLSPRFSYRASINPVDELAPLPSCGEPTFFYPNDPLFLGQEIYARGVGPNVSCDPNGRRRVDMYRGIALDPVDQQGAMRELWLRARLGNNAHATFGRMLLPIGFDWESAGSLTAKDAPMIQRINAEANFGLLLGYQMGPVDRRLFSATVGAVIGEGNAWKDYAYQFFQEDSLDGNRDVTGVASALVRPIANTEVMVSVKVGNTGSKIERFSDSYFAGGKHNDNAIVFSARHHVNRLTGLTLECARYTWGLTASSAEMVGSSTDAVDKRGCYVTVEAGADVRPGVALGGSYTWESIDRADAMVRYLAEQGLYGVTEGQTDGMNVIRVFLDFREQIRIGYFYNNVSNPYPWVSGITPVEGANAFLSRSLDRWGIVARFTIQ
jgi:hypothetical protein